MAARRREALKLLVLGAGVEPHDAAELREPRGPTRGGVDIGDEHEARRFRGADALDQASLALDGAVCRDLGGAAVTSQAQEKPSCFYAGRVRISELQDDEKQPLPLGWLLSDISKGKIEDSIGRASDCPPEREKLTVRQRNSCLLWQIGEDLRAGIEPPANAGPAPWTAQVEGAP